MHFLAKFEITGVDHDGYCSDNNEPDAIEPSTLYKFIKVEDALVDEDGFLLNKDLSERFEGCKHSGCPDCYEQHTLIWAYLVPDEYKKYVFFKHEGDSKIYNEMYINKLTEEKEKLNKERHQIQGLFYIKTAEAQKVIQEAQQEKEKAIQEAHTKFEETMDQLKTVLNYKKKELIDIGEDKSKKWSI